MTPAQSN